MIDDALAYAAAGWRVFPCRPDKTPYTASGFLDASADTDQVREWWGRWPDALIGAPTGERFDVLDDDPRHGGDRHLEQLLARQGPLPDGWLVKTPGGGHHRFFRPHPDAPNGANRFGHLLEGHPGRTGLDVKAAGGYVILPPSGTAAGVYVWLRGPGGVELPDWPAWCLVREPARVIAEDAVIPSGSQHDVKVSFAGVLRDKGATESEILAFLREVNKRCERPATDSQVHQIARSAMKWQPGSAADWMGVVGSENGAGPSSHAGDRFSVRQLREEDIRAPRWAFDGWFLVGALNGLVGVGGAGKGTLMAYLIAKWSQGELPGHHEAKPANALIVGDEDSTHEVWAPRILAAGGNLDHVFVVSYDEGVTLDLVRDIGVLEDYVTEHDIHVIYIDQVLDHLGPDLNAHAQKDVRRGLAPVRSLARRLERTVGFTAHPNKLGGAVSLRDRTGGSGQFVDLPRSAMVLGWHPDKDGYRALARGKGNVGATPPALVFRIDTSFVTNPKTGEIVDVPVVADLQVEAGLAAEGVSPHPPRPREPAAELVVERVVAELGADREWHSRREAEDACVDAGVGRDAFNHVFPRFEFIEREKRGREMWWRVKDE